MCFFLFWRRFRQVSVTPSLVNYTHSLHRVNLSLPYPQDDLIATVAQANPNTIVVLHGPGPVLMPWIDSVKAVIFAFFPGQESGTIACGDAPPSFSLIFLYRRKCTRKHLIWRCSAFR